MLIDAGDSIPCAKNMTDSGRPDIELRKSSSEQRVWPADRLYGYLGR